MDIVTKVREAITLTKNKEYKSAENIYLELLKHDKNNATILSLLGLLYLNTGKLKRARTLLLKSDKLAPNNPTTIEALGFTMYNFGEYEKACAYFNKIIDNSKNHKVYEKYASALIELKSHSKAYLLATRGNELFPLNKDILATLIYACVYTGNLEEAYKYSQQLISAFPKESKSWLRQGLIHEVLFHDEETAQKCYKNALKYGDKSAGYHNLSISCNKIGEHKKAEIYIKKVIKKDGLNANNCFALASTYFFQRKFKQAFKYYAIKDIFKASDPGIKKLKSFWNGKRFKDETLLVYCDQGIGDCLMFSRYFFFLEKFFKEIKILVHPSLINLLKISFKDSKKIKFYKFSDRFPKTDKAVIMSDLPHVLKIVTEFPLSKGYLKTNEKLIEEFKTKYFNSNKLKVGICWEAGAAGIREQLNRTLHISVLDEILNLENIEFYSLQYKPTLDDYKKYKNLIDIGSKFKDFNDTASAIKNLDVVLTVDTSVAHLAGALGVKTFMILPYCPDWRWFDNTKTTEWYDSMTIFKQTDRLFYDKEISDIKAELEKLLK